MAAVQKRFAVALDIKRPTANRDFEVVEGDTGNVLEIELTDDGVAIDLTGCRVLAVFSSSKGAAQQDTDGNGVALDTEQNNKLTISLYAASVAPGLVECELQVYSGEDYAVLATSAKFNFMCRRGIANGDVLQATEEWPLLANALQRVEAAAVELAELNTETTMATGAANDAATAANNAGASATTATSEANAAASAANAAASLATSSTNAANSAATSASGAASSANSAASAAALATTAANSATVAANAATSTANAAASSAASAASSASNAATSASSAATSASSAASAANSAASEATTAAGAALSAAEYANDQGDYAKAMGEAAEAIVNSGTTWDTLPGKPTEFTPASHAHGNITNDGKIGTTPNLPVFTGEGGNLETKDAASARTALDAAKKPVVLSVTLTAAGWSSGQQTISNAGIPAISGGDLYPASSATDAEYTAFLNAQIRTIAQAAGSLTVKALGTVPAISIPAEIEVRT